MDVRRIQVLWELADGKAVWWDADVTDLQSATEGIKGAAATVTYRACHGHPISCARIKFENASHLQHLDEPDLVLLRWRTRPVRREPGELCRRNPDGSVSKPSIWEEVRQLRLKVSEALDKVSVVHNELELASFKFDGSYSTYEREKNQVSHVLTFLRHRLVLQLQRPPRRKPPPTQSRSTELFSECEGGGIARACIRVQADCDLRTFEILARMIKTEKLDHSESVAFIPSYEVTQLPNEGSARFKILFHSFAELAGSPGINSVSDRMEMMTKYGISRGEGVMRLLGTYEFDENDLQQPSYTFIGKSCGRNSERFDANENCFALYRQSRNWNMEDRRYEEPLQLRRFVASFQGSSEKQDYDEGDVLKRRWFHIG